MNGYASMPWYIRHGFLAGFFSCVALAEGMIIGAVVVFVVCFVITMSIQIAIDGWDHKRW